MKIAVLTSGRFHVLDLARELHALGHDVRFYSYVPKHRSRRFGLPDECARSGFFLMVPLLIVRRILPFGILRERADLFLRIYWDWIVSKLLEPCDVVIAMSGCFNISLAKAKTQWDALILVERGSRHILSQKEILDSVRVLHSSARTVPEENVRWELRDYERADRIVVASRHVVRSFMERGVDGKRLFRNPYGVDLTMFSPTLAPEGPPTLLMVGTWSYQKGCDLLVEALRDLDLRLLHAGSIGDCPFPSDFRYRSLGVLDQTALAGIYAQAHVMVLPSRAEGLALVQAQALACGVHVLCSDRTGGEDLREMLDDRTLVTVVKAGDVEDLRLGIQAAMTLALERTGVRSISKGSLEKMSWEAYGRRYGEFLTHLISRNSV